MAYATPDDMPLFDPTFVVPDDTTELEGLLEVASRDIELAIGLYGRDATTGDKLNVANLVEWRQKSIARACCAQAQYHMFKGEEFFASVRPMEQGTREGSMKGQEPFIGPKCSSELARGGFYRLTSGRGRSYDYYELPNQDTATAGP